MPLKNKANIVWGDETYELVVTLEVIDEIESRVDVLGMVASSQKGNIRLAARAKFVHAVLCACDGKYLTVDPSDIYLEINNNEKMRDDAYSLVNIALAEMFPDSKKNEEGDQTETES